MENNPPIQNQEVLQKASSNFEVSCLKLSLNLRTEQNNLWSMIDLVEIFTNTGEVSFSFFSFTCSVSKSFLLLPKHLRLVCFDRYDTCLEGSI